MVACSPGRGNLPNTTLSRNVAIAFLLAVGAFAQRAQQGAVGWDEYSTNTKTYSDEFSTNCGAKRTSPYAGMDPVTCRGVEMPVDSSGKCTASSGWRFLRRIGNTCYFCVRRPPPAGGAIVIPIDQLQNARVQGWACGVDQTNPGCTAVCTRFRGSGPYLPPGSVPVVDPLKDTIRRNDVPCPGGIRIKRENYSWEAGRRLSRYKCRWDDGSRDFVCCPGNYWTGYEGPIPTADEIRDPNRGGSPCANPAPPPECRQTYPSPSARISPPPRPPTPACAPEPDWVRQYRAEGAGPPIRYQVGFNQGVAKCLQDQCKVEVLAVAAFAARFQSIRALLAVSTAPGLLDAILHPPGFSAATDPYVRGKDEGSRLCDWFFKFSIAANFRRPIIQNGRVSIPRGFNFRRAFGSMRDWLPKINPSGCQRNCGLSTSNWVRVLFGRPLEAAPPVSRGWTDRQMEQDLGGKFNSSPVTDVEMNNQLQRLPEGTVGVVSGDNVNFTGNTPKGRITNPNDIPGHFFGFIKVNGQVEYWDPQNNAMMRDPGGTWIYRYMIVGNPLNP